MKRTTLLTPFFLILACAEIQVDGPSSGDGDGDVVDGSGGDDGESGSGGKVILESSGGRSSKSGGASGDGDGDASGGDTASGGRTQGSGGKAQASGGDEGSGGKATGSGGMTTSAGGAASSGGMTAAGGAVPDETVDCSMSTPRPTGNGCYALSNVNGGWNASNCSGCTVTIGGDEVACTGGSIGNQPPPGSADLCFADCTYDFVSFSCW